MSKICFLADGTSIHTFRWCNYFANIGHEVHLTSLQKAEIENIQVHYINCGDINKSDENWRVAGVYSQILVPWFYFDFIRMAVSQVPIILRKQTHMLFTSFIGVLALTISILTAGLIFNDIKIGLYFSSAFLSILVIYITFWIYKISENKKI
jgi:hypothetical protein